MGLWTYRGLQLIMIGLLVHLLTFQYERFLQVNRCPFCKADVPDGADLCPSCFRSLTGVQGIDIESVISMAATLFLIFCTLLFGVALPYPHLH